MEKLLLTGERGFVGRHLLEFLHNQNTYSIQTYPRQAQKFSEIDWYSVLENCSTVIHLAARSHVMHETEKNALEVYREMNAAGTINLAKQAAACGVRRFIFLSSIKVNGEVTQANHTFHVNDPVSPVDYYALSKWEAEQGLWEIGKKTGMEIVIIRPVLIYGPNVKGNLRQLLVWLSKGVPLPLASINNKRSLLSVDNLVDFISICISHPLAANQTFLLSDNQDWSTPELLAYLGSLCYGKTRLWPCPVHWLLKMGEFLGKYQQVMRLCSSLQVDCSKAQKLLGWEPKINPKDAMRKMVEEYQAVA